VNRGEVRFLITGIISSVQELDSCRAISGLMAHFAAEVAGLAIVWSL
jgi:hypothetical protein